MKDMKGMKVQDKGPLHVLLDLHGVFFEYKQQR